MTPILPPVLTVIPLEERVRPVVKLVLRWSGSPAVLAIRINAERLMKATLRAVITLMVMACLAFRAKHATNVPGSSGALESGGYAQAKAW